MIAAPGKEEHTHRLAAYVRDAQRQASGASIADHHVASEFLVAPDGTVHFNRSVDTSSTADIGRSAQRISEDRNLNDHLGYNDLGDASYAWGVRDHGQFGSYPVHDGYCDEDSS